MFSLLAVSCAQTGQNEVATQEIIVTAQHRVDAGNAPKQDLKTYDVAEEAPAAPPPPVMQAPALVAPMPMMESKRAMGAMAYAVRPEPMPQPYYHDVGRDRFTATQQNPFKVAREEPVSTFSIDVDTASYSFVRATLSQNVLPQPAAVRTEEMINYFPYSYASPKTAASPFTTNVATFPSPWTAGRKIVRIGIKGYAVQRDTRPRANLVFLIDTSGSMNASNKLPLVKQSLSMLLDQLDANDHVAIVTYAGSAGTALEPTPASQKAKILSVIEQLGAGGSTAGAEGIRQA